ncbi:acetolactate synthase small subunit [Methanosphaera sp. WGK6]|uniref:acetolactate synthase small subunit n=1 Tax=Methanosphaera sp. WGK6 TaxID=1561964 RepID=UPI00084CD6C9|nr:acetolactate synthase small subunit [Methanosphaera sp. WGK6]OED30820.1 acetolactate synthase [Methanosphaera sp. WGK6]
MGKTDKHTISILVENKPGVLQRISGLFTRRNFNIDNISVGKTEDTTISRITIRTTGDNQILEQITKQLNKLVEVIKVRELKPENTIKRQLVLMKVHAADETVKTEIIQYTKIFRGHLIDVTPKSVIIQITGDHSKITAFTELMKPYGIKELAKTGVTAINRGNKTL